MEHFSCKNIILISWLIDDDDDDDDDMQKPTN